MKKIMFDDRFALTEAVLEGRKTKTRRILDYEKYKKTWDDMCRLGTPCFDTFDDFLIKRASRYQVGEVVAVAQRGVDIYRVLKERFGQTSDAALGFRETFGDMPMWFNKMYTPAGICLSRIRVTDIKVEQLQDISDEDCMCEGVTWDYDDYPTMSRKVYIINDYESFHSPRLAFAALINRINGKSTWETNPYVFAYTFELEK